MRRHFNQNRVFSMSKRLIIILFLPALIALGHDVYLMTQIPEKGFMLADLGWIWDRYHKESHDQWKIWLNDAGVSWAKTYIGFMLQQKAVAVFAALGGVVLFLIWVLKKIFTKSPEDEINAIRKRKGGAMKYGRK